MCRKHEKAYSLVNTTGLYAFFVRHIKDRRWNMELLKGLVEGISKLTNSIITKITKSDKWKLYLYYQGQCIKRLYVDDDFQPMEHFYVVKVRGMKHLLGTNRKVQIIVRYFKYKLTDNDKKEVHIETINFEGSDLTV